MKETFQDFIKSIKNKRAIVWGLGLNRGGLEAVKYFTTAGAKVTAIDLKKKKELAKPISELKKFSNIEFILGKQDEELFEKADLIIKNPAISWDNALVKKLLKRGVRIETDVTLFFRFFRGKVVGVTGSKGKTTTTMLVHNILKEAGKDVLLGGNIRVSLFSLFNKKSLEDKNKIAVLELSSFQLEDLEHVKRSPEVAIVTNILRDHLNRYGGYKKYIAAKKNICYFQNKGNFAVLNKEDAKLKEFAKCKSKVLYFTKSDEALNSTNWIFKSPSNQKNLAAAVTVAEKIFGIKKEIIEKVVENFKGVPYRLEKVGKIKGVEFINDTAATIPDAAINNLKSFDKKVILISGGADKKLKFAGFAKAIAVKVKKIILLPGSATPLIINSLEKHASKTDRIEVNSMDKAVKTAYKGAVSGDTVLLSPGCASFGLFQNEFDRGDQFNEVVKKLKISK